VELIELEEIRKNFDLLGILNSFRLARMQWERSGLREIKTLFVSSKIMALFIYPLNYIIQLK
jgi:hypothetical protein